MTKKKLFSSPYFHMTVFFSMVREGEHELLWHGKHLIFVAMRKWIESVPFTNEDKNLTLKVNFTGFSCPAKISYEVFITLLGKNTQGFGVGCLGDHQEVAME